MPTSGELPEELRTYRLLKLGLSLTEIDGSSALRLDELLGIDSIYKEVEADAGRSVDGGRQRGGLPGVAGEA